MGARGGNVGESSPRHHSADKRLEWKGPERCPNARETRSSARKATATSSSPEDCAAPTTTAGTARATPTRSPAQRPTLCPDATHRKPTDASGRSWTLDTPPNRGWSTWARAWSGPGTSTPEVGRGSTPVAGGSTRGATPTVPCTASTPPPSGNLDATTSLETVEASPVAIDSVYLRSTGHTGWQTWWKRNWSRRPPCR